MKLERVGHPPGFASGFQESMAVGLTQHLVLVTIMIRDANQRAQAKKAAKVFGDILDGANSCSMFFGIASDNYFGAKSALGPGELFGQETIRVNTRADKPSIGATTQQGGGPNGIIFLNPLGPFFNAFGMVRGNIQPMKIGPFGGGTLQAQTAILAHEFAHLLNTIPSDSNDDSQSANNTRDVLEPCEASIRLATKGHK